MNESTAEFVTIYAGGQMFGIPVLHVRDVLAPQLLTPIPLAPRAVAGALNLRGRIITAIDLRMRLDLPPRPPQDRGMNIVVEHNSELYSLLIDRAGEVISLPYESYEKNPTTLDARWQSVANGIYRLNNDLLIVLDVARLLELEDKVAA